MNNNSIHSFLYDMKEEIEKLYKTTLLVEE